MTAIYSEAWPWPPASPATVPAGAPAPAGPDAPETWVMAGDWAAYPAVSPTDRPPSLFRVFDLADPREIIVVTRTAGGTWEVRRAAEGSPGVAHLPGFQVRPFITKAGLDGRAAGTPSGTGLIRRSALTAPMVLTGNADHTVAAMTVPGGEAIAGSVYEVMAWGYYTPGAASSPPATAAPHFNCGLHWDPSAAPGTISFPVPGAQANARWRIHATVNLYAAMITSTITLWAAASGAATAPPPVIPAAMFGPTATPPASTSVASTFRLRISTGTEGSGTAVTPGAASVTVLGAWIGRTA